MADGTIVLENRFAENKFKNKLLDTKIYKHLNSYDALCYEFTLRCKKPRPFVAAAKLISKQYYLAIFPITISSCTFSIILALKTYDKAQEIINTPAEKNDFDTTEFIKLLTNTDFGLYTPKSENYLFEPKEAVIRLTNDLKQSKNISLEFILSDSDKKDEITASDMGLLSFSHIFAALVFVINHITSNGKMEISILPKGKAFELQIKTRINRPIFGEGIPTITTQYPSCRFALALLEFMTESSGCNLFIRCLAYDLFISLASDELGDNIDFRSCDQFAEYSNILESALRVFDIICTEADQASE